MVSIITVNFNNLAGLITTVESVQNQVGVKFEHIIVDGLSTDGSKEYIYNNLLIFKKVISEKDNGIYHAMNKGLKYANGDHVIFLNSGDSFFNSKTLYEADLINKHNKIVFGSAVLPNGKVYPEFNFNVKWLKYNLPNHQAIFFPKTFYKYNNYDESFKIVGDSEYKFRALNNCDFQYVKYIICNFNLNGISNDYSSFSKYKQILNESLKAAYKYRNFDYLFVKLITHTMKYIKYFFR